MEGGNPLKQRFHKKAKLGRKQPDGIPSNATVTEDCGICEKAGQADSEGC